MMDFSLFCCSSREDEPGRPSLGRPPGPSAVCRLQSALGLRPRRALSSAEANGLVFRFTLSLAISRFRFH
jgi:hypothetical protein